MYELIYMEDREEYDDVRSAVEEAFPAATIRDASDDVHQFRIAVEADTDSDDFLRWAIGAGCFLCTLGGQLMLHQDPDKARRLLKQVKRQALLKES